MKKRGLLALLFATVAVPLSFAQIQGLPGSTSSVVHFELPHYVNTVTGQPYSGDETRETVQMRITKVYRDSAGRTRTESAVPVGAGGLRFVEIYDVVAHVRYVLDPQNKIAHCSSIPGLLPTPDLGSTPAALTTPRGVVAAGPVVSGITRSAQSASPPASTGAPAAASESSQTLGRQTIDGVLSDGTRASRTYPAGRVLTVESWYSPELQVAVLTKNSDSANGENTMRLLNLIRSEPDKALFQVPSDYAIVNETDGFNLKITIPNGQ